MTYMSYEIIPEKKLIIEYVRETLFPQYFIKFKESLMKDKCYNPDYNVISYICDAKPKFSKNLIEFYRDFIKDKIDVLGKQIIFVTDSPMQVAGTLLLKDSSGLDINVFSSVEAAVCHLQLPSQEILFIKSRIDCLSEDYHENKKVVQDS